MVGGGGGGGGGVRRGDSAIKMRVHVISRVNPKNGVKTIALTSTDYEITDPFRHEVNAAFPFYYCDQVVLKTMIRSNPGIMLMKGSTVVGMWHNNAIPSFEKLNRKYFSK